MTSTKTTLAATSSLFPRSGKPLTRNLICTFLLLLLFAGNAAAQCAANSSNNVVYIQLPSDWDKTIYLKVDGMSSITPTEEGAWLKFNMPATPNANDKKTFSFSNKEKESGDNNWIGKTNYNVKGQTPSGTAAFQYPADFSTDACTIYISEAPNNPGKTYFSTQPPNAKYFYFYPPDDEKWIAGTSYLTDPEHPAVALSTDPDRCGWYKAVYFNEEPPAYAQIWLSSKGTDKIGASGRAAELEGCDDVYSEDCNNALGAIELGQKFEDLESNEIYFLADDGYEDGWYASDPGIGSSDRCTYSLAAIIYDTDRDVNDSFFDGGEGTGIAKDIVNANISPNNDAKGLDRKMAFSTAKDGWTANNFRDAFRLNGADKSKSNMLCYDMPFQRNKDALWEFDSDKLNTDGSMKGTLYGSACGFFPPELQAAGYTPIENDCGTACSKARTAQGTVPLNADVNEATFNTGAAYGEGDFKNGDIPGVWDWGNRCKRGSAESWTANELFCFESHAEFTKEEGQKFYFRGDDDLWVFINGKLELDLGGTHLASPGMIDLDKLSGLTDGEKYPIDIFFCDRRTTMSNVRITTNMYFSQKSDFYSDPYAKEQQMCVATSGGNSCVDKLGGGEGSNTTLCGNDLINGGYKLEFYMIGRGATGDTIWLDPVKNPDDACSSNGTYSFNCYGGISIVNGTYSCGGRSQCQGNTEATAKVNKPGNFTVYVKLLNQQGVQTGKAQKIDVFKSEANVHVVWGEVESADNPAIKYTLKDSYNNTSSENTRIVAGRRTPIYIASGAWNSGKFYFDELEVEGTRYSLAQAGLTVDNHKLNVYTSKNAESPDMSNSYSIPASGIDTLWVEAEYDIGGDVTYEITMNPKPKDDITQKITAYLPTLRFVADTTGRDTIASGVPKKPIPFVGTELPRYLMAYEDGNRRCETCTFSLTDTSWISEGDLDVERPVAGNGLSNAVKNGVAAISISGQEVVTGVNYATWRAYGPSKLIVAEWDSLQFKELPVPRPVDVTIWDRNGDGIGDSIAIYYDKSFKSGDVYADSLLPNLIEIIWSAGDTIRYHLPSKTVSELKDSNAVKTFYDSTTFRNNNHAYWYDNGYIKGDSLIVIADTTTTFSAGILTFSEGTLRNYATFRDMETPDANNNYPVVNNVSIERIKDRIPPIVVQARYIPEERECGDSPDRSCRDNLIVQLSERVFAHEDASSSANNELTKNPFEYCLGTCLSVGASMPTTGAPPAGNSSSFGWNWEKSSGTGLSNSVKYKPSNKDVPPDFGSVSGDSTLDMIYRSYASVNDTTRTPKAGDWIKLRHDNVFKDSEGNSYNENEIGVRIEGKNRFHKDPVYIAELKPNGPSLSDALQDNHPWLKAEAGKNLYQPGNVAEFLPVPEGYGADSAKKYYPASAGPIFVVDIANEVAQIVGDCNGNCKAKDGTPLTEDNIADNISVHANVYYHTNLGNYVADRKDFTASCNSALFQNASGDGNCLTNRNAFYLAWNLKTNNDRLVGTGAYVAVTKFYWQIEYTDKSKRLVTKKYDSDESITLYGVRRSK